MLVEKAARSCGFIKTESKVEKKQIYVLVRSDANLEYVVLSFFLILTEFPGFQFS